MIGICRRRGLGRVRHLAVADLWIQDKLRTKDFFLHKVAGADNIADMLTKHLEKATHEKHVNNMNFIRHAAPDVTRKLDSTIVACCLSRFHQEEFDDF